MPLLKLLRPPCVTVGRHAIERQGVELPLATDENGLRLDVLEKIGSEEMAKQEQKAEQESKAASGDQGSLVTKKRSQGQTGQQPKKVRRFSLSYERRCSM